MQVVQTIGIDLPLKFLVWEDAAGKTWLSYNEPAWLATRHHVSGADGVLAALASAVGAVGAKVAGDGLSLKIARR